MSDKQPLWQQRAAQTQAAREKREALKARVTVALALSRKIALAARIEEVT